MNHPQPQLAQVLKYWTQGEITNSIKVWTIAFASLFYTYSLSKTTPKGLLRLLAITPVICLNFILPLYLHTLHIGATSAFFLAWLANFKLLLFAFDNGPLSDSSISYPRFAALACLPIKPNQNDSTKQGLKSYSNYLIKALLLCLLVNLYEYTDSIHPKLTWAVYCFHIYFALEIIMAGVGSLAMALVGIELEPQFDEPYLSGSLQEFWGRRWNIMVARILHPTVYEPVLKFGSRVWGRKWASLPAIFASFLVSGLMHELIFYYMGRNMPSGELTLFFLLHGVCLAVEVAIKKEIKGRWQLPRIVSGPLTIGFVMVTAFWLFFPEFLRVDGMDRGMGEYEAMGVFVRDVAKALGFYYICQNAVKSV